MLEENPPWKIIPCWSLDREINWPSNWPVLEAVATTAKRWSNGGWENNVNWSERDRRTNEHRIGWIRWTKGILDETGIAPLRDYIPSPGMFRDDGTIFLIFLHGSTRSPLIGNRCAFNLPAPPHPRLGFLHRLPRVFSDIFAMYFKFHGKLTRTRRGRIPARHVQGIMTHYRKWRMGE